MNLGRLTPHSAFLLLAFAALLPNCSSNGPAKVEPGSGAESAQPATTDAPAASGTPAMQESAAPVADKETPRQKEVRLTLKALAEPEMDDEQRGRIAAAGLGEGDFGLPAGQIKAFNAVVGQSVDPSQCATILGVTLEETAKPLVEKRCGKMDALLKSVKGAAKGKKAETLIKACKIADVDAKVAAKANPWAVLASAIVQDQFAADPKSNDDEKKIAKSLVYLCPGE